MADIVLNGKTYTNVEEVMLPDGNGVYVSYAQGGGKPGEPGEPGEDGGYYTPSVTQTDAKTMSVAFVPSKSGMPAVAAKSIALPSGKDGADGKDGVDGYTPVKGKDYFDGKDGYTPQKNVDYFDGKDGQDGSPGKDGSDGAPGKDGVDGKDGNGIKSAVLNADYTLTLTFDDGTSYTTPSIRGASGADGKDGGNGKDGQNGLDGEDGVGIATIKQTTTSTADGGNNVFTVTLTNGQSATFTVKNGSKGSTGEDGKDYVLTNADKQEIAGLVADKAVLYTEQTLTDAQKAQARENIGATTQAYVDDEIADLKAQGVQQTPLYPEGETVDECLAWLSDNGDQSKTYLLPDGFLYQYKKTVVDVGPTYTNQLKNAINSDGTPYIGDDGEIGYDTGRRLNSSGVESTPSDYCLAGFIPVKANDIIRMKNITKGSSGYYLWYGSDFKLCTALYYENYEGTHATGTVYNTKPDANGMFEFPAPNISTLRYVRISTGVITENSIITINEEITEGGGTTIVKAWTSTGHAFIPADYDAEIARLKSVTTANATEIVNLKNQVENLENGNAGGGSAVTSDELEILLPYETVAVVGVEFNLYYKSVVRASRSLDNYDIKAYLSNSSIACKRYSECFRLTPTTGDVGDCTLTVEVRNLKDYAVVASKSMTLHIIANTAVSGKNVLFIGDSLTFSRAGLYAAEIQHNLSSGGMASIGSQNGSIDINQIGNVKHEGYNGATIGGFLKSNVASAFINPFYNPSTGTFDLAYFMSNQGYSEVDAVCLNLGHNNLGNEVAGVSDLKTIITKIHAYNANIPVIISLITPLGDQNSHSMLGFSAGQMRYHWRQLIKAYIDAFDGGKISNVYLSTPYFNVDQDNDLPTETVARCSRDNTQIVRQNDSMHPTRVGTLKMADVYYAHLLYRMK